MNLRNHCFYLVVGALLVVASGVALAGTQQSNDEHTSDQGHFPASNSDLVNTGQSSLVSHLVTGWDDTAGSPFTWQALNNGNIGVPYDESEMAMEGEWVGNDGEWTSTFTLDTSTAPHGYSITEIRTIAAYNYPRANQQYTVSFRTIYNPSFVTVGTFTVLQTVSATGATQITLTDTSGAIDKNVDAIRIDWSRPTGISPGYHEIDVFGTATPATNWTHVLRGPALTDDADLIGYDSLKDMNFGNSDLLDLGGGEPRRPLLRFDLSSLSGRQVEDAALQLTIVTGAGSFFNALVNFYAISAADADWEEMVCTWNEKAPGVPWSGGPGLGAPTGTHVAQIYGSDLTYHPVDHEYTIQFFAGISFIQNWIDNPASNGGFLIQTPSLEGTGNRLRPGSSDNATLNYQPSLLLKLAPAGTIVIVR